MKTGFHKIFFIFSASFTFFLDSEVSASTKKKEFSSPPGLSARITYGKPVLAPFAHVRFCMTKETECQSSPSDQRAVLPELNAENWAQLVAVNTRVNRAITSHADKAGAIYDEWSIDPVYGDCDDYAVSKRHHLIKAGWPPHALLLAHVRLRDGQEHLILTIRTQKGDLVLDNLNPQPRPAERVPYDWVKIQSWNDPKLWHKAHIPVPVTS
jgi:predicted transglutaminase-like cysteine proteinase